MGVEVQIPRLGFEFLGEAALPLVGAWLDSEGSPITEALPVIVLGLDDTSFVLSVRIANDNDEDKVLTGLTFVGPSPFTGASASLPVTIPAHGLLDVPVTFAFDGTQLHRDTTFADVEGTTQ